MMDIPAKSEAENNGTNKPDGVVKPSNKSHLFQRVGCKIKSFISNSIVFVLKKSLCILKYH